MSQLIQIITAHDSKTRNTSLDAVCRQLTPEELLQECAALDQFRRSSDNLYERVRALFFLYAIHRFHIPLRPFAASGTLIPFSGYTNLLKRRFEEALDIFLSAQAASGPSQALSSALAAGYRALGFQLWRTRFAAVCAPSGATSGCSAPRIPRTLLCGFGLNSFGAARAMNSSLS